MPIVSPLRFYFAFSSNRPNRYVRLPIQPGYDIVTGPDHLRHYQSQNTKSRIHRTRYCWRREAQLSRCVVDFSLCPDEVTKVVERRLEAFCFIDHCPVFTFFDAYPDHSTTHADIPLLLFLSVYQVQLKSIHTLTSMNFHHHSTHSACQSYYQL